MTNNPTIDGVSRAKIHHLKIHAKPFEDLVSGRKTSEVRNCADREFREGDHVELFLIDETGNPANKSIVRTITHIQRGYGLPDDICVLSYAGIDAPAVERQEPVAPFYISTEDWSLLVRGDVEIASVRISRTRRSIFTESLFAHPSALQSTIAQLEDKLNKAIDLDFQRRETIEQLQARVQELESRMGEPIGWVHPDALAELKSKHSETWPSLIPLSSHASPYDGVTVAVFTAPPAPVALLLPELYSAAKEYLDLRDKIQKEGTPPHSDYWHQSLHETDVNLRCCLDAPAALTTVHVGELDPAERLALARGEPK